MSWSKFTHSTLALIYYLLTSRLARFMEGLPLHSYRTCRSIPHLYLDLVVANKSKPDYSRWLLECGWHILMFGQTLTTGLSLPSVSWLQFEELGKLTSKWQDLGKTFSCLQALWLSRLPDLRLNHCVLTFWAGLSRWLYWTTASTSRKQLHNGWYAQPFLLISKVSSAQLCWLSLIGLDQLGMTRLCFPKWSCQRQD